MMHRHAVRWVGVVSLIIVAALVPDGRGQCPLHWLPGPSIPGVHGTVRSATTWDPDGPGPQRPLLVIGGAFTIAGDVITTHIAAWDGSRWRALGGGLIDNGPQYPSVNALTVFDDGTGPALYVGGAFTAAGNVAAMNLAKWNGTTWTALWPGGSVQNQGSVSSIVAFDDGAGPALYVGGYFTSNTTGVAGTSNIARWDGASWSALGDGVSGGSVGALAVFDDGGGPALYASGQFTSANPGAPVANRIAKWNGASWAPLGSGFSGGTHVTALAAVDDGSGPALFAGGSFTSALPGAPAANNIAKWNGSSWSALGNGVNGAVNELFVFDDGAGPALIAGGTFLSATPGAPNANHVARWNGASWSAMGSGVNNIVACFVTYDDGSGAKLHVGSGDNLAAWNGTNWSWLNSQPTVHLSNMVVFGGAGAPALYAGGVFESPGAASAYHLVHWNGAGWSPASAATNGIGPVVVFDDGGGPAIFAAGGFTSAVGTPVYGIAKWDGVNFSLLGTGINGSVFALEAFDDGSGPKLYAAGDFSSAGGTSAQDIARWDAEDGWRPVGSGLGGRVYDLAVFDDGSGAALYAAGTYPFRLAKWNGTTWSVYGLSIFSDVFALEVFDDGTGDALYFGGGFQGAGGTPGMRYIGRWNGTAWSPLDNGVDGPVYSLTTFDDGAGAALYAAGTLGTGIKKWRNGWSAVGLGISGGTVSELAGFDDGSGPVLFAAGGFTVAGGQVSYGWARWGRCSERPGDLDCDRLTSFFDIDPLLLALFDPASYDAAFPDCDMLNGDMNADGLVNFFDIDPFVACLFGTCP